MNPDGSMRRPGGTVTTLGTLGTAGYMNQLNNLRSINPESAGGGYVGGNFSSSYDPKRDNAMRARDTQLAKLDSVARLSTNSKERAAALRAYAELSAQDEPGTRERVANMQDRGETARSTNRDNAGLRIAGLNNETERRGQDVVAGTARTKAQIYAAKSQQERADADRRYNLDVAKFGVDVAEKNRTAGEAATKAQQTRLENTFRTTDDNGNSIPDQAKIASYNAAVDTTLPELIKALAASGNPEALAKSRELRERGQAAMTADDHARLIQMFSTREQLRGTRSILPGGAEFNESNNLLNFRQAPGAEGVDQRTLTPDRIRFAGGSSATPNDLSIRGGANAILPDLFKTRTDELTRGLRFPE